MDEDLHSSLGLEILRPLLFGCRIRQEQQLPHQLPWACLFSLWAMAEEARMGRREVISWVVLATSINSSTLALLARVGT
jgi:hypothetical protein